MGNSAEWRSLKHRVLKHMERSSKTHSSTVKYKKQRKLLQNWQKTSVKNQLRTAIGVVQTNCVTIHYDTRVAELYQAGTEFGDIGHSRMMFPQMIDIACRFIDLETIAHLKKCLPNTGLPSHFYCTADKSTNHRVSNQATMMCPVIERKRSTIPLGAKPVYLT